DPPGAAELRAAAAGRHQPAVVPDPVPGAAAVRHGDRGEGAVRAARGAAAADLPPRGGVRAGRGPGATGGAAGALPAEPDPAARPGAGAAPHRRLGAGAGRARAVTRGPAPHVMCNSVTCAVVEVLQRARCVILAPWDITATGTGGSPVCCGRTSTGTPTGPGTGWTGRW